MKDPGRGGGRSILQALDQARRKGRGPVFRCRAIFGVVLVASEIRPFLTPEAVIFGVVFTGPYILVVKGPVIATLNVGA